MNENAIQDIVLFIEARQNYLVSLIFLRVTLDDS